MTHQTITDHVLTEFGLHPADYQVQQFGSGLINHTFKVSGQNKAFILQQVNEEVFKQPEYITDNLSRLQAYFSTMHPNYLFAGAVASKSGSFLIRSEAGAYYRLFEFIEGSHTINSVNTVKEAFEAAKQFGKFTVLLNDFDAGTLKYTLTDFHNLSARFKQFKSACKNAQTERINLAADEIKAVYNHYNILQIYKQVVTGGQILVRVIHHDTKISNVLFDKHQNGLCVIDLDTVMPGYFLSDVGDMMRTYLSPANEEETDLSKVTIREDIFAAICSGYLSEMGSVLTPKEKEHFIFSGEMMIYMQAIRFLTDYLNNDIYYKPKYEGHNLNRAKNQFKLLSEYIAAGEKIKVVIAKTEINNDILQ